MSHFRANEKAKKVYVIGPSVCVINVRLKFKQTPATHYFNIVSTVTLKAFC